MKKIIAISVLIAAMVSASVYAKKSNSDAEWQNIGEQGKKALTETGKFFSDAGKKIYEEATTPECYGKWICKNGKSRTTVECKQNGSMTITQKTKGKTAKWSGTFTATSHTITFKITSVGGRAGESTGTWILTYNLQEGGKAIKIQSLNLPNDGDGTNFKLGALFTK